MRSGLQEELSLAAGLAVAQLNKQTSRAVAIILKGLSQDGSRESTCCSNLTGIP